jgi:hypothetical protein
MENQIEIVLNNIVSQARFFLNDAGEFYPFGTVIKKDGQLSPVSAYLGTEHPESLEVFKFLAESLKERIRRDEALVVGIGLDVFYSPREDVGKVDALKVMILTKEGNSVDYYLPYHKQNGQYTFGEIITEEGSL